MGAGRKARKPRGGPRCWKGSRRVVGMGLAHDCGRWASWGHGVGSSLGSLATTSAEAQTRVFGRSDEVGVVGARAPPPQRRRRRGRLVVVVHVTTEAEGVFGVIVVLLIDVTQRFLPEIIEVVRERWVRLDDAPSEDGVWVHFTEVGG